MKEKNAGVRINVKKLKSAMVLNEMTQTALSEKAGVCRQTINGVCCGRTRNPGTLRKIAEALEVDPDVLIIKKTKAKGLSGKSAKPYTDVMLPGGAELHRFLNKSGIPYSAIYRDFEELYSCHRDLEEDMIEYYIETLEEE